MFCKRCGANIDRFLSNYVYECPICHQKLDAEAVNIAKSQLDIVKYEKWSKLSFVFGILSLAFSLSIVLFITGPLGIYFTRKADGVRSGIEAYLTSMDLPYIERYRAAKKKLNIAVQLSKIAIGIPLALIACVFLWMVFNSCVLPLLYALF